MILPTDSVATVILMDFLKSTLLKIHIRTIGYIIIFKKLIRGIIGALLIKRREQTEKKSVVSIGKNVLPEALRISSGSNFCWINIYGEDVYGPIFWERRSDKSEEETNIIIKTEMELKP
jgi:hypothetical protein